jgi:hypothetical protein
LRFRHILPGGGPSSTEENCHHVLSRRSERNNQNH